MKLSQQVFKRFSEAVINMPKPKISKKESTKPVVPLDTGPITVDKNGDYKLLFLAKPGAKHNNITDVSQDGIGIQINAPPVEGQANTELISYLSKLLNLRKSDLSLDRGSKSRHKTIIVSKDCDTTLEKLTELIKSNVNS